MTDIKPIINLAKRIREHLPVSDNYLLKSGQSNSCLIKLSDDNLTEMTLNQELSLPDIDKSEFVSLEELPAKLNEVFSKANQIIVTPLTLNFESVYLFTLIETEIRDPNLMLSIIDLILTNDQLVHINNVKEKKYQDYIREVKTIKEKLLPAEDYVIEGLDYATYYRPSIGGGGDYFDLADLRAARRRAGHENPPLIWGVGVMDVSGHGPGAAVEVAMVDAILRTYQGEKDGGPAEAIAYVNKHFFTRQSRGGFCTGFACNYDAEADLFSYTSAGHLPVLIKHREGHITTLESESGIPIGIEREYQWVNETTQLEQGDTIIIFTDGITEAESLSGEQFGMERLISCLENSPAGSAEVLMSNFMDTFHQHISNSVEQDDQTLIMVTISS